MWLFPSILSHHLAASLGQRLSGAQTSRNFQASLSGIKTCQRLEPSLTFSASHRPFAMRDIQNKIEVFIRPFGSDKPYPEYETSSPNQKLIEATTGERYEVVVLLHDRSRSPGRKVVQAFCRLEGGAFTARHSCLLPRSRDGRASLEIVLSSKAVNRNGEWREVGFSLQEIPIGMTIAGPR